MPNRITLSRAKGWRKPEGAIVVARPSIWGNPWGVGNPGTIDLVLEGVKRRHQVKEAIDQTLAVELYGMWIERHNVPYNYMPKVTIPTGHRMMREHLYARRMQILANIHQLRGHDLCCWCKPGEPCHGDVLLRLANGGEG